MPNLVINTQELLRIAKERGISDAKICNATKWDRTTLWRHREGKNKKGAKPTKLAAIIGLLNA